MSGGDNHYRVAGHKLKTIREERGIDLQQIHRLTGISMVKLVAIEDGDYANLKMSIAELDQCIALYSRKLDVKF